jgi:hypothetical protein
VNLILSQGSSKCDQSSEYFHADSSGYFEDDGFDDLFHLL